MLPMVGQGAIAVECRADDSSTLARLAAIDDADAHAAVDAERAYLARLGGGCSLPCAALATVNGEMVSIEALLAALDGSVVVRARAEAADPTEAGDAVAQALFDQGGRELLGS
jgi:hydroxymethylbilane synthase